MDQSTIDIIKATAPVVAAHAQEITKLFYKTMFENSAEAKQFFNVANQSEGRQPAALANAIIAYATNIDNLGALTDAIELIAAKHCGLQVLPEHYPIVHDNLMIAVGTVLGDAVTPEIATAWSNAVNFLGKVLIDNEAKKYEAAMARSGGWRGWKNFVIDEVSDASTGVKTFTFKPEDQLVQSYEFTAGQYLSITVDLEGNGEFTSPRHYTVTSKPGEDFFQITVKHIEGGQVSSFLHNSAVGTVVRLSPPFGPFALTESSEKAGAVLLSAGIGRTPMTAFMHKLGASCIKSVHVDKNEPAVPFFSFFETQNEGKNEYYFSENGRPAATDIVTKLLAEVGTDRVFYVCGPTSFMMDTVHALVAQNVPKGNIQWEAFSPQLSCPV